MTRKSIPPNSSKFFSFAFFFSLVLLVIHWCRIIPGDAGQDRRVMLDSDSSDARLKSRDFGLGIYRFPPGFSKDFSSFPSILVPMFHYRSNHYGRDSHRNRGFLSSAAAGIKYRLAASAESVRKSDIYREKLEKLEKVLRQGKGSKRGGE